MRIRAKGSLGNVWPGPKFGPNKGSDGPGLCAQRIHALLPKEKILIDWEKKSQFCHEVQPARFKTSILKLLVIFVLFFCFIFRFLVLKTLFFGILDAKPCRTIVQLPKKVSFGSEMWKFNQKSGFWRLVSVS